MEKKEQERRRGGRIRGTEEKAKKISMKRVISKGGKKERRVEERKNRRSETRRKRIGKAAKRETYRNTKERQRYKYKQQTY